MTLVTDVSTAADLAESGHRMDIELADVANKVAECQTDLQSFKVQSASVLQ